MRSFDVIQRTATAIKQVGFRCEAYVLSVSREDSLLGVFQRFEGDKQRTGVGRFSPIDVHDEAYQQSPVNLAKANAEMLFDRIVVYTRQTDGQLQIGLDTAGDQPQSTDFVAGFERLRQPIFTKSFYHEQCIALGALARQRAETNETYLRQIGEFIHHYSY
ncbi:zeta toxin family protein [Spirosoma sp. KNUC1025]|uniref:zeta toxin family protein n=1 Tax=Spirosoma sp. KNUC1025 TaxID=2894082 RepID=UPI0038694B81